MTQYYLSEGQQPRGPFPLTELRAQGLRASSLIWHEQMSDWLPATAVPEVQALLPKLPPALPTTRPALPKAPPPVPSSPSPIAPPLTRTSPRVANKLTQRGIGIQAKRKGFLLGGGTVVVLLVLLAFRFSQSSASAATGASALASEVGTSGSSDPATNDPAAAIALAEEQARQAQVALAAERRERQRAWNREHFMNYVRATVLPGYEVGTFGGISGGYIQFSNNSGYRLQNVVIAVQYIKASGDVYKTEYVSIDELASHQTTTQAVPDCGRGVQLTCSVYQLAAPGLEYTFDINQTE
jgi:hypothetical protein